MAARTVEYIFQLIDKFSPNAGKMSAAAKQAEQSINNMGQAFNRAESRGAAFAIGERRRLEEAARSRTMYLENAQKQLDKYHQQSSRTQAAINTTATAIMTAGIGRAAMKQFDDFIEKAAEMKTAQEKMRYATGGNQGLVDQATGKAFSLSSKYKNVSAVEGMHIIDDLRANLPEELGHVIDSATEPFVKMHSFFKAWNGGKHKGHAEQSLRDIGAAIRAGELTGAMSGDLLAKHVENLAIARIQFGDKFKVQEYFQATQKAATMLSAADETFKYVDFPVLVQRLSQGGGVAARGMFQKLVAGATVSQGTAEMWRALGLVNLDQVQFNKDGKIKANSLIGRNWLKGGNEYGVNMTDAIMTRLVPALATKGGIPGLAGMDKAWKAGDVGKLVHILEDLRKDPNNLVNLSRVVTALGKDPKATQGIEELILGAGSIMRDRQAMVGIKKMMLEKFQTYDKSKQTFGAQWDNMIGTLGGPLVDFASRRLENLANIFEKITQWAQANPDLAAWTTNLAMIGAGALLAAAGLGAAVLSMKVLGALMGATAMGGLVKTIAKGGLIGAGIYGVVKHWDTVKSYIASGWEQLKGQFGEPLRIAWDYVSSNDFFASLQAKWASLSKTLSDTLQAQLSQAITGQNLMDDGSLDDLFTRIAKKQADAFARARAMAAEGGFNRADSKGQFESQFEAIVEWSKYYGATAAADLNKIWADMVAGARAAWAEIKKIFSIGDLFDFGDWSKDALEKKWKAWATGGKSEDSIYGPARDKVVDFAARTSAPAYLQPGWAMLGRSGVAADYASTLDEEMARERARGGWRGGDLTASEAQREISIKTQVGVEGAVNVKVDASGMGTGWANIRGTGTGSSNSGAPRGESASFGRGSSSGGSAP